MSKMRIYEYAREKNISSKEVIEQLAKMDIEVSSHMSSIGLHEQIKLDEIFDEKSKEEPKEEKKQEQTNQRANKEQKKKKEKPKKQKRKSKKGKKQKEQDKQQTESVDHLVYSGALTHRK